MGLESGKVRLVRSLLRGLGGGVEIAGLQEHVAGAVFGVGELAGAEVVRESRDGDQGPR